MTKVLSRFKRTEKPEQAERPSRFQLCRIGGKVHQPINPFSRNGEVRIETITRTSKPELLTTDSWRKRY